MEDDPLMALRRPVAPIAAAVASSEPNVVASTSDAPLVTKLATPATTTTITASSKPSSTLFFSSTASSSSSSSSRAAAAPSTSAAAKVAVTATASAADPLRSTTAVTNPVSAPVSSATPTASAADAGDKSTRDAKIPPDSEEVVEKLEDFLNNGKSTTAHKAAEPPSLFGDDDEVTFGDNTATTTTSSASWTLNEDTASAADLFGAPVRRKAAGNLFEDNDDAADHARMAELTKGVKDVFIPKGAVEFRDDAVDAATVKRGDDEDDLDDDLFNVAKDDTDLFVPSKIDSLLATAVPSASVRVPKAAAATATTAKPSGSTVSASLAAFGADNDALDDDLFSFGKPATTKAAPAVAAAASSDDLDDDLFGPSSSSSAGGAITGDDDSAKFDFSAYIAKSSAGASKGGLFS